MKSQNQLQQFHSNEFGAIDILMIDSKPYFPAAECAQLLGYSKPHNAIARHCPHSLKRGVVAQTTNQHGVTSNQSVEKTYIPEGDLYRLIIRSKLPAAVRFEAWVCDEILPSIRKHGAYATAGTLDEMLRGPQFAEALIRKLDREREKNAALLELAEEMAPKALYCDLILQCKNTVPVSLIAKDYGMSAAGFNCMLHDLGVQYRIAGTWLLYQEHAGSGYTITRTYCVGENTAAMHTSWTQKGRLFLYETLKGRGVVPQMERAARPAVKEAL
jgi:prophage antirepressor-like protein